MSHFGVLAVLCLMPWRSLGFTMDRSALISSTWDTAPSLDAYQKVFVDTSALNNGKLQVTGMDKILQAADAKVSAEPTAQNQTRDRRSTTEMNSTTGSMKLINDDVASLEKAMRSDVPDVETTSAVATSLRNVILLLIDGRSPDERNEGNPWEDYKKKLPFAIEGFLQSCRDETPKPVGFAFSSAVAAENKEKDCDCERILRSSIVDLLSWARHTRGMTTGTVSSSNFSIPSSAGFEFDAFDETEERPEPRMDKRDHNPKDWQMIDLGDRAKSISTVTLADRKSDGAAAGFDDTWDVFDVLSKIRMTFFRFLLEMLSRNNSAGSEDEFALHRPFPGRPSAITLIESTIKQFKSFPNDKGYMLIASVPSNERTVVIDLLQREISPKDTLFVIMEMCSGKESVPFMAEGLNSQVLREMKAIWDLPAAIRKAIGTECRDPGCTNRTQKRSDVLIVSRVPTEISSQGLPVRRRVIRHSGDAEKPDTVSSEKLTIVEKEMQARSSSISSRKISRDLCGAALAIAISVFAAAALTSS